jgi:hypothetical protein
MANITVKPINPILTKQAKKVFIELDEETLNKIFSSEENIKLFMSWLLAEVGSVLATKGKIITPPQNIIQA